jgi:hypothetical protein
MNSILVIWINNSQPGSSPRHGETHGFLLRHAFAHSPIPLHQVA